MRGQANIQHVVCRLCNKRFPDALGVALLIEGGARDSVALWAAVTALGYDRPKNKPLVLSKGGKPAKEDCPHYLAWLKVEGAGTNVRGTAGNIHIRCAGCKQSWNQAGGLKVFLEKLKADRLKLRSAIRSLGGKIE
jgi:hypothetical protein